MESPGGDRQRSVLKMMFYDLDFGVMMVEVKKRCGVQVAGHSRDAVQ